MKASCTGGIAGSSKGARMDCRVASIAGKIDAMLAPMDGNESAARAREEKFDSQLALVASKFDGQASSLRTDFQAMSAQVEGHLKAADSHLKAADSNLQALKSTFDAMKYWLVGTGIAVVLGIAAFNATVLSNMVASFELGKNTAAALTQTSSDLKQTQEQHKAIQERLDKQTATTPARGGGFPWPCPSPLRRVFCCPSRTTETTYTGCIATQ